MAGCDRLRLDQTLAASARWQPTKAQWSGRCWCCWLVDDQRLLGLPHPQRQAPVSALASAPSQVLDARQYALALAQQPFLPELEALAPRQQASSA